MRKWVVITLAILVTIVVIALLSHREPRYQGRALTLWLHEATDMSADQKELRAREAIRALGAPIVLPTLLKLATTRENRITGWIANKSESLGIGWFQSPSAADAEALAICGFEALGTNGAPAIGALTMLLDDKEKALVAIRCLDAIGKPAELILCQSLTNQNVRVREWSIGAVASVTDDVDVYIARIKDRLNDSQSWVRSVAIEAIGTQTNAPDLVLPLLLKSLEDPDDTAGSKAVLALARFGTNAMIAFPALTNLANSGQPAQTKAAMETLIALAPREAIPVLSNAVANGNAANLRMALKYLDKVAPELALQMTLAQSRSDNAIRRSHAVSFTSTYDISTPGIVEVLKSAVHDDDPEVVRRATGSMKRLLEKQKQKDHRRVIIPGEPMFNGKPMGTWLKAGGINGNELSTESVSALKKMGTNVIPALLARLAYKDPVFGLPDQEVSMEAVTALIGLGPDAKTALPALTALMDGDDEETALRAMVATLGTGKDALPCLLKGLTNRSEMVRTEAIHFLVDDENKFVAHRQQAVPLLLKLLHDPSPLIRTSAERALKQIDAATAAKAGIK